MVDTIVARATPRGASALSVIRLSGPRAVPIAASVFEGHDLLSGASHTAHVGFVRDGEKAIDQVVATLFLAPNSSTGETVVELTCHGGDVASDAVIDLLTRSGARPAEPGEYSLRSFLNGKIDLTQAEAIADLIHARSARAGRISLAHLRGRYSEELGHIRASLIELVALLELELDFSEEDVEFADRARLESLLESAGASLKTLLGSFRLGKAISSGIRVVIVGLPNAGKSTLLNALVGYDRAIVSEVPGTTRDEIDCEIEVDGIRFQFVDTAGIRDTDHQVEAEGVRRSLEALRSADLCMHIVDLSEKAARADDTGVDIGGAAADVPVLRIGNKLDLLDEATAQMESEVECDVRICANRIGEDEAALSHLLDMIKEKTVGSSTLAGEHQVVTNARQQAHIRAAATSLDRARRQLAAGGTGDMLSSDIRRVIEEIGSITGEVTNEDILDQIFSRFCIGK